MPKQTPMADLGSEADRGRFLTPDDWLRAAVNLLIDEGVDQVKVQRLAKALGASRGSFYWHFRNRQNLLDEVLLLWKRTNTDALIESLGPSSLSLEERILGFFALLMEHHPFFPRFDNAIRAWAAKSPKARKVQRTADRERQAHCQRLFLDAGYEEQEARVRGDVLYFNQVGYYVLDLGESKAQRLAKLEAYLLVFTGRPLDPALAKRFRARQLGGLKAKDADRPGGTAAAA